MSNYFYIARYHKRKRQHVCIDCGVKVGDGRTDHPNKCDKHREASNLSVAKIIAGRKAQALCVDCGDVAVDGRIRCQEHLDAKKAAMAKKRADRVALGLCANHGRIPLPGKKCCGFCNGGGSVENYWEKRKTA